MEKPKSMLRSSSVEGSDGRDHSGGCGAEQCRLSCAYLGVNLAVVGDEVNTSGERKRRELTGTAEWSWSHQMT